MINRKKMQLKAADLKHLVDAIFSGLSWEKPENSFEFKSFETDLSQKLKDAEKPEALLELAKNLEGKKTHLIAYWIKKIGTRFLQNQSSVPCEFLSFNNPADFKQLQNDLAAAAKELVTLEIDLSKFTLKDLQQLSELLSRQTLFCLSLRGPSALAEEDLQQFLSSLKTVQLVRTENLSPKVEERANQVTYRNCMMNILGVETSRDPQALIKKWSQIPASSEGYWSDGNFILYYLKVAPQTGVYARHLKRLLNPEAKKALTEDEAAYHYRQVRECELYDMVNMCVSNMDEMFFEYLLENVDEVFALTHKRELRLNFLVTENLLKKLVDCIQKQKHSLPFKTISLRVHPDVIKTETFFHFLKALEAASINNVLLSFDHQHIKDDLSMPDRLLDLIKTTNISYPVTIVDRAFHFGAYTDLEIEKNYNKQLVAYLHERNLPVVKRLGGELPTGIESKQIISIQEEKKESEQTASQSKSSFGDKIQLKKLIHLAKNKKEQQALDISIPLEVQHIEEEREDVQAESREVVEEKFEHKLELTAKEEKQENIANYEGDEKDLVTYKRFLFDKDYFPSRTKELSLGSAVERDCWHTLGTELFANFPKAIKYLSHEAAVQIAQNYPAYVALNTNRLPSKFCLKKTAKGECVLDYDPNAAEEEEHVFTPQPYQEDIHILMLCADQFHEDLKEVEWMRPFFSLNFEFYKLWERYGKKGLLLFSDKLKQLDAKKPGLADFLMASYVANFHLDKLFNRDFFDCLEQLAGYDDTKLACLQKFLEKTGASKHKLSATLKAFGFFWSEVRELAAKENKDKQEELLMKLANATWKTPPCGSPVVYMERLLTILKNARSFTEQVDCLDGLYLSHNGAYYASRFEGFKLVSAKEMEFSYNREDYDKLEFNAEASVYRVALSDWAGRVSRYKHSGEEKDEPVKKEMKAGGILQWPRHLVAAHRFLATQTHGIKLKDFAKLFDWSVKGDELDDHIYTCIIDPEDKRDKEIVPAFDSLLAAILAVSHERYAGSEMDIYSLLLHIKHSRRDASLFFKFFLPLYDQGIKLNEKETLMLAKAMAAMNSFEFERNFDKQRRSERTEKIKYKYLNKLFNFLANNKYATLRGLSCIGGHRFLLPSAIDTAEFLSQDPDIAVTYKDDIFIFSALINSVYNEMYLADKDMYFAGRDQDAPTAEQVAANVVKVKEYLNQAVTKEQPNNLDYAFRILVQSRAGLGFTQFLSLFAKINELETYNPESVISKLKDEKIILHEKVYVNEWFPENEEFNQAISTTILRLQQAGSSEQAQELKCNRHELLQILNANWEKAPLERKKQCQSMMNGIQHKFVMLSVLDDEAIKKKGAGLFGLTSSIVLSLADFSESFVSVEKMLFLKQQAINLARHFVDLMAREGFGGIVVAKGFSGWKCKTVSNLFSLLQDMPQRKCGEFLKDLIDVKQRLDDETYAALLQILKQLHQAKLPSEYFKTFIAIVNAKGSINLPWVQNAIFLLEKNKEDELLSWLLSSASQLEPMQRSNLIALTCEVSDYRAALQKFLANTLKKFDIASALKDAAAKHQKWILEILAKGYAASSAEELSSFDYGSLVKELSKLSEEKLQALHEFYQKARPGLPALSNALKPYQSSPSFAAFLEEFEKAPYGERNFKEQFSLAEVERVVNESTDLLNQTVHTYGYRKQLMEAFLVVNQMGESLPVYDGKAAKDLTNAEISQYFQALKNGKDGKFKGLDRFKKGLCALALMREAMYRATGKFPNSMQIIALIDCLMHNGNVLQNIGTGQGKIMLDAMKAGLLYLEHDRGHVTTSSLADGQRDIEINSPFFSILSIPCASKPIKAATDFKDYAEEGINYSTFSQLSLFLSRAEVEGHKLGTENDKVFLVINETDHAILDERTTFRYAVQKMGVGGSANNWIYAALNEIVCTERFAVEKSVADDLKYCRESLQEIARDLRVRLPAIVKDDEQLLTWIESAILVNFKLTENEDFVCSPASEQARVAYILQKDGRVNHETKFGNGVHQLLHAKLGDKFVIDPESKTIVSTNNNYLIKCHNGRIWGSSATVGSPLERAEQNAQFGFEFSQIASQQKNQTKFQAPHVFAEEKSQFDALLQTLRQDRVAQSQMPALVFLKDIESVKRFSTRLQELGLPHQMFTGMENEAEVIRKAAIPGMITVTTSALGRNTDIPYNHAVGMKVYQCFWDAERGNTQKAGRTGRQGSPGEVHYYLNQRDLGYRDLKDMQIKLKGTQEKMDRDTSAERKFNRELYDILGYFLNRVRELVANFADRKVFYRVDWSAFSEELETRYRAQKQNGNYKLDAFVNDAVELFHSKMEGRIKSSDLVSITKQAVLQQVQQKADAREDYHAYERKVTLADCVSPELMGQYFSLKFKLSTGAKDEIKANATKELEKIFADLQNGKPNTAKHYLCSLPEDSKRTTDVVKTVKSTHQEFLATFLQQAANQNQGFFRRWLGFQGHLNKIANSRNYLLLFRALTSVGQEAKLEDKKEDKQEDQLYHSVRAAVKALLSEYLSYWFVSGHKKAEARALISQVNSALNMNALVSVLAASKLKVLQEDIKSNRDHKLRFLKPVNLSRKSRFQTITDTALNLISACGNVQMADDDVKDLFASQPKRADKAVEAFEKEKTLDNFMAGVGFFSSRDKANTGVLKGTITRHLEDQLLHQLSTKCK